MVLYHRNFYNLHTHLLTVSSWQWKQLYDFLHQQGQKSTQPKQELKDIINKV